MSILFLTVIAVLFSILSKHIYTKWINQISIYAGIWYFVLSMYELKLMSYVDIKPLAWATFGLTFICFFLGSVTVYIARQCFNKNNAVLTDDRGLDILADGGRIVNYIILITSVIGLFAAIQHWIVLIKMFGSIPAVLLKLSTIYRLRTDGRLQGVVPYVYTVAYVGVFFSGMLVAYKNRLTLLSLLPLLAVILKEIANAARAGMLLGVFIFIASFLLTKIALPRKKRKSKRVTLVFSFTVFIALFIAAAGLVRTTRSSVESFSASSGALNKFQGGFFITPSLYLYFSSHVGVFSEYISRDYEYRAMWGESTFMPVYNIIAKTGAVKQPEVFETGYYIPMWTNTATYLRPLLSDFGVPGLFLGPYLLGMITSVFWFLFYEKRKVIYLVGLTYFFVIIMFSYITIITKIAAWMISLVLLLLICPFVEKMVVRSLKVKNNKL